MIPVGDFVMGSRWIPGRRTFRWGISRQVLCRVGTRYARLILGFPISDFTGSFNTWTNRVLSSIDLPTVRSNGFSFQIELKYRALNRGFKSIKVPIVIEAIYRVWHLRFAKS